MTLKRTIELLKEYLRMNNIIEQLHVIKIITCTHKILLMIKIITCTHNILLMIKIITCTL